MRIVQFHEYGGPEVLRVLTTHRPEPDPGELLIEVTLIGVSLAVVRMTYGDGAGGGVDLPHAPSGEVVGRVAAFGEGVEHWEIGQRVAGLAFSAGYAEYATIRADLAAAIPDAVSDEAAVALVRGGQVALGAARAGRIRDGDSVLVTAAAGGVGHLAVQVARSLGAGRVVGAVGSPGKLEMVRALGADVAVTYEQAGDVEPVDVVLDGVGGSLAQTLLGNLAVEGRFVTYSGASALIDLNHLRMRSQTATGFAMAHLARRADGSYRRHQEELIEMTAAGRLRPVTHPPVPLSTASEAHVLIETRANRGKVVIDPNG